jgi:hypothetical protein
MRYEEMVKGECLSKYRLKYGKYLETFYCLPHKTLHLVVCQRKPSRASYASIV